MQLRHFCELTRSAILGVVALLAFNACTTETVVYRSPRPYPPPPPPMTEYYPPRPAYAVVWVPGHWRWNGHRYIWVRGHYRPA